MITHMRLRAGVYFSALLLLVGVALTAQATQAVTSSQMHEYVLTSLGAAGVVVFGAFWVLLITISGRSEKALMASVQRLEKAVAEFTSALKEHDGGEHAHWPISERIDEIDKRIDAILRGCAARECGPMERSA